MKDPAFLFYSKDFYEGTRTMLPRERACFIDLMIYQHQHGPIPDDTERMTMYCSGIDEATLKATLKAKFKQTDEGWVNERLQKVATDRKAYTEGQSVNGRIGQFWKKVKAKVTVGELRELKRVVYDEIGKERFAEMMSDPKATLEGLLEGLQKHIANANEIESNTDSESLLEAAPAPTHKLVLWIAENCPRVAKMKKPLTNSEAEALMADLQIDNPKRKEQLKALIMAMENYGPLTKSLSANLTIRNWWKRDRQRDADNPNEPTIKLNLTPYNR